MKAKARTWIVLLAALVGMLAAGCGTELPGPPRNVEEYTRMSKDSQDTLPRRTIVIFNLKRAMDPQLDPNERIGSLMLLAEIGGDDQDVKDSVAGIASSDATPAPVRAAAAKMARRTDIDTLASRGKPADLAEVVKRWAEEPTTTGPEETRFRGIVERNTGYNWDMALLEAINTESFLARGSAIEVLAKRLGKQELKTKIRRVDPKTDAFIALRKFVDKFDYVPARADQFIQEVVLMRLHEKDIDAASKLCTTWEDRGGYKFDLRDFHLLSRLASDPLRADLPREQLVGRLSTAIASRRHVTRPNAGYKDDFTTQSDRLSLSDLWNLYLLNEMLSLPRKQLALRVMAEKDRADTTAAWGGLVFYENGVADARLYTSDAAGDRDYVASKQTRDDRRDSLCQFFGRFDRADNGEIAGPTASDLSQAAAGNYCGMVLTSISEDAFAAHYYNPQGIVISLGVYPFRK